MSKTTTKKNSEILKMNEEINHNEEFSSEPGNNVINNILNFSKALSVKKLKNESYVELVLN
jgi:hypothetical protein